MDEASGSKSGMGLELQIGIAIVLAILITWLVSVAAATGGQGAQAGSFSENFRSWVRFNGWFYLVVFAFILSIFVSIIFYAHLNSYASTLQDRKWADSPTRIVGRVLAILGGLAVLVGLFLPWGSVDFVDPALADFNYDPFNWSGTWIFLAFGLLWFIFFAVPRKVAAVWGFVWGCLALLNTAVAVEGLYYVVARNTGGVYLGSGVYVSILGSTMLIVGSALAYVKARRTVSPEPSLLPTS
ncbi:MAG TPA: hypothetical protein VEO20_00880 [Thermoplasmata archaeon]|nr:hypothetical protein [Thermoplasmata archaeon]